MQNPAETILREYDLQNLQRTPILQRDFEGKYVFMLHDYVSASKSPTGIRYMRDYDLLMQCGARVVNAVFTLPFPWSIQPVFDMLFGKPTIIDDNYCLYTVKSVKNDEWVNVQHGFVKNPYDKNFMTHMKNGDRATLNNIIVDEKDAKGDWDINQMNQWFFDYESSKAKSAKLLSGFDAFVFATTQICRPSLNLLRYARETMPCYLDSGFIFCYNARCGKTKNA